MQAITVLADHSLQDSLLHQLHKHHVCGRWNGLSGLLRLYLAATHLSFGPQLPNTRTFLRHEVITPNVEDKEIIFSETPHLYGKAGFYPQTSYYGDSDFTVEGSLICGRALSMIFRDGGQSNQSVLNL